MATKEAVTLLQTHQHLNEARFTDDPEDDDDDDEKKDEKKEESLPQPRKYKVYVGIDFGTDGCGISYGLNNGTVFIHNRWKDACGANEKPETSILFDDKGNAKAYGSKAKQTYIDLNDVDNWMLFEKYKMSLYTDPKWRSQIKSKQQDAQQVDINTEIYVSNNKNKKYSSEKIFVTQLKYLYKQSMAFMLNEFKQRRKMKFKRNEIQWILTVPAIWSDRAKNKMKEWAKMAGLITNDSDNDQLKIVYEPDCASLSIQYALMRSLKQKNEQKNDDSNNNNNEIQKPHRPQVSVNEQFEIEDKYMLIDVGGGTADIACHRIMGKFEIEELLHPTGGKWGCAYVDVEFIKLLQTIFSKEWMDEFVNKQLNRAMYHQLISNFVHDAKRTFYDYGKLKRESHHISIPRNFIEFLIAKLAPSTIPQISLDTDNFDNFDDFDDDNDDVDDDKDDIEYVAEFLQKRSVELYGEADMITIQSHQYSTYSISLKNKIWFDMFDVIINPIIEHCKKVLNNDIMRDTKYIFLVGGLANSKYFQQRIKNVFHTTPYNIKVVVPELPQLCVVDGAARYGITPTFMKVRKLALTYGIAAARKLSVLNAKDFPKGYIEDHKFYSDVSKQNIVRGCFYKFAERDKSIHLNDDPISKPFSKLSSKSNKISIAIYTSNKWNPATISKEEATEIGHFILNFNESDDTKIVVQFSYNDTTLKVFAYPENKPNQKKEISVKYH